MRTRLLRWIVLHQPSQAMPRQQSSVTFRLALETFEDVKTQLVGLTEESKTIRQAVDNLKSTVQRKRKEVQRLVKKVAGKRKSLRALQKKSGKTGKRGRVHHDEPKRRGLHF